jgi:cell division transport system permease protein
MSFWFSLREGIKGLGRARLASLITISSISFALFLVGLFIVFSVNVNYWIDDFRSRIELEIFLEADIQNQAGIEISKRIAALESVGEVTFISKEEAAKRFEAEFGRSVYDVLETNPLPSSVIVKMKPGFQTLEHITELANKIYLIDGVSDIVYQRNFILLITRYINIIYLIGISSGVLLVFIAVVLLYNTIRLTILARSDIIEIMKLVGATKSFVRRPFLIEGFIQGASGAVISGLMLYGLMVLIRKFFYAGLIVPFEIYGSLLLLGIVIGVISSKLSISRYLQEI